MKSLEGKVGKASIQQIDYKRQGSNKGKVSYIFILFHIFKLNFGAVSATIN